MERWRLLGGLLKKIGHYNVTNFEDRLIAQKLAYIIQEQLKENLGYNFNWYVYGPYTSPLADDFYKLKDTNEAPDIKFKLDKKENKFQEFVSLIKKYNSNREILESLTCFIYLKKKYGYKTEQELLDGINRLKPYFSDKIYKESLTLLNQIEDVGPLDQ